VCTQLVVSGTDGVIFTHDTSAVASPRQAIIIIIIMAMVRFILKHGLGQILEREGVDGAECVAEGRMR
jgi:hypothetical protein